MPLVNLIDALCSECTVSLELTLPTSPHYSYDSDDLYKIGSAITSSAPNLTTLAIKCPGTIESNLDTFGTSGLACLSSLQHLSSMKLLYEGLGNIESLPQAWSQLSALSSLALQATVHELPVFPVEYCMMPQWRSNLKHLRLNVTGVYIRSSEYAWLTNLESLHFESDHPFQLTSWYSQLINLKSLTLRCMSYQEQNPQPPELFVQPGEEVSKLTALQTLTIDMPHMKIAVDSISSLTSLRELNVYSREGSEWWASIHALSGLTCLRFGPGACPLSGMYEHLTARTKLEMLTALEHLEFLYTGPDEAIEKRILNSWRCISSSMASLEMDDEMDSLVMLHRGNPGLSVQFRSSLGHETP